MTGSGDGSTCSDQARLGMPYREYVERSRPVAEPYRGMSPRKFAHPCARPAPHAVHHV